MPQRIFNALQNMDIHQMMAAFKGGPLMLGIMAAGAGGGIVAEAITDSTTIQIGLVAGLLGGVFYAGMTLQKLKDSQKSTNARLSRIERRLNIDEEEDDE